jgi:hypothetical protein
MNLPFGVVVRQGERKEESLKERLIRAFKLTKGLDEMEVPDSSSERTEYNPQAWTTAGHLENAEMGEHRPTVAIDPNPNVKGIVCRPDPEEDRRVKAMRRSQPRTLRPDQPRPKPVTGGAIKIDSGIRGMAATRSAVRRAHEQRQAMNAATYKPWPKSIEEVAQEAHGRKMMDHVRSELRGRGQLVEDLEQERELIEDLNAVHGIHAEPLSLMVTTYEEKSRLDFYLNVGRGSPCSSV